MARVSTRVEFPEGVSQANTTVDRGRSFAGAQALMACARFARRKPLGALGAVIVAALLVMAVFAGRVAPYDYDEAVLRARLKAAAAAHPRRAADPPPGLCGRLAERAAGW